MPDHAEAFGVRDELARALASLSESDRELVLLVAWEGLSVGEAATALGCRSGTAAVRLHRRAGACTPHCEAKARP